MPAIRWHKHVEWCSRKTGTLAARYTHEFGQDLATFFLGLLRLYKICYCYCFLAYFGVFLLCICNGTVQWCPYVSYMYIVWVQDDLP